MRRVKRFWFAITLLWRVFRLIRSGQYLAARYAVNKTHIDESLKPGLAEAKRTEALEWMGHYAREYGITLGKWESRFLLELAVGLEQEHIIC